MYPDDYIEMEAKVLLPLRWMAPEFLARASTLSGGAQMDLFKAPSKEANMWSLGITLWEVAAFGNTPFQGLYNSHFLSAAADSHEIVSLLRNGPGPVELTVSVDLCRDRVQSSHTQFLVCSSSTLPHSYVCT